MLEPEDAEGFGVVGLLVGRLVGVGADRLAGVPVGFTVGRFAGAVAGLGVGCFAGGAVGFASVVFPASPFFFLLRSLPL